MRPVDFDQVDADTVGALRGGGEGTNGLIDLSVIHFERGDAAGESNRRGIVNRPSAVLDGNRFLSLPGHAHRAFASGVIELHAKLGATIFPAEGDCWGKRFGVRIGKET